MYKFCCILLLIHWSAFTGAAVYCKDNETNAEYIIPDTDPVKNILNSVFNTKMSQLDKKFVELITAVNGQIKLTLNAIPSDCHEALIKTQQNGIYNIYPNFGMNSFDLVCHRAYNNYNGDWTVIMRRFDGSVDFYRNWIEYKNGFGNLNGEFFIGLDKLHVLTTSGKKQLLIVMSDVTNVERYAKYDAFAISNESEGYELKVLGNYSGNGTDSLRSHVNLRFTTVDVDNDNRIDKNCAQQYTGAWWFKSCHNSHLFGRYSDREGAHGMIWNDSDLKINIYLRAAEMLIKSGK